jgi:hypothetical protein
MPKEAVNDDELILEGIVVTLDPAGVPNIAPMGPRVDRNLTRLVLRPFQTSQTWQNLKHSRRGVFHVIDDVELLAHAAVGRLDPMPRLVPLENFPCPRLAESCRWLAFEVANVDDQSERTTIACRVVASGVLREFFGFNRAKHAVVEAAILATRIGILPAEEIRCEMARLAVPVSKTAGVQERRAFEFLRQHVEDRITSTA